MPTDPTPDQLTTLVLLCGGAIGIAFGAATQATRFCTMGGIADLFNFGDATRLRMWVGAALVAMLGTQALIVWGGVDLSSSVYTGRRLSWLAQALGGMAFGFGMVLASGCPSRNLARAASGSLKAVVVLIVVGLVAQMSLRGLLALPRVNGLEPIAVTFAGPQDLPSMLLRWLGADAGWLRWAVPAAIALPVLAWLARGREFWRAVPLAGTLVIGALVTAAWWVSGSLGHLTEHPETLEAAWLGTTSRRPEALSFVAPTAQLLDLLTLWSDRGTVLGFGTAVLLGTLAGGWASAMARREFRWEGFGDVRDLAQHLGGAALMGAGGVLAIGCSIGQGLSGLSVLSIGSVIAVAGIVVGAVLALRYQVGVVARCG